MKSSNNGTSAAVVDRTITTPAGALAGHPGDLGEQAVVRWTVPLAGRYDIAVTFRGFDSHPATTDVAVWQSPGGRIFSAGINLAGAFGNEATFLDTQSLQAGTTLDFVVGYGNADYQYDTTGIDATIIRTP